MFIKQYINTDFVTDQLIRNPCLPACRCHPKYVSNIFKLSIFKYVLIFLIFPFTLLAQNPNGNYNPYVNNGTISPSPLWPTQANGSGIVSFNFGNTGSDPLQVYTDQFITLTITLSYGLPDNANPLSAVGGTSAGFFTWSYSAGTYTAVQKSSIPPNSSGAITIAYKVTENSLSPGLNGFNVNISPAPYQTQSNSQNDDAVSSYTYTEIRDYGDAPASYGIADHVLDYTNYLGSKWDGESASQASPAADGDDVNGLDDEDGVVFPALIQQGATVNVSVTVTGMGRLNAWIDWNGDGDFADAGERVADNVPRFDGTADLSVTVPSNAIISAPTFARFRFAPSTLSASSGSAVGGEVEDYRIVMVGTVLAPTVPTGLKVTSSSVSSVGLSWDASTDNVGVTGYRIYRSGSLLTSVTGLSHSDNTVAVGNTYTYTVSAYDAEGNESSQSSPVSANTNDTAPPTIPTGLKVSSSNEISVNLSWNAATDNVAVTGYRLYRGGNLLTTVSGLSYTDNTVSVGNSYNYSVAAIDAAGNASSQTEWIAVNIKDVTAPAVPQGLKVTSSGLTSISLSWNATTDNLAVTGYRVYRGGSLLTTTNGLSFTDNTVTAGNSYTYSVSAIDAAGNESAKSSEVTAITSDTTPPSAPTGLIVSSSTDTTVTLSWNASTDNVIVSGYKVYRAGSLLTTITGLTFTDSSVILGNSYNYKVSAMDDAGNESAMSDEVTADILDTQAPTVPGGLQVTAVLENAVGIIWEPSGDNDGVSGYSVYRDGILLGNTIDLNYLDNTVVPGITYSFTVLAFDAAGNKSDQSSAVTATIFDSTPPTKPTGLRALSASGSGLGLSWDEASDNVEVKGYNVYRGGVLLSTVDKLIFTDKSVVPGDTYTYNVSAYDGAGNESESSDPLIISLTSTDFLIVSELSIYPNPSDGKFVIEINEKSGKFNLEVISASGSAVVRTNIYLDISSMPLNFDFLDKGLYFIRLFNNDRIYYGKLMIQN